jgi:hypothetical protein
MVWRFYPMGALLVMFALFGLALFTGHIPMSAGMLVMAAAYSTINPLFAVTAGIPGLLIEHPGNLLPPPLLIGLLPLSYLYFGDIGAGHLFLTFWGVLIPGITTNFFRQIFEVVRGNRELPPQWAKNSKKDGPAFLIK